MIPIWVLLLLILFLFMLGARLVLYVAMLLKPDYFGYYRKGWKLVKKSRGLLQGMWQPPFRVDDNEVMDATGAIICRVAKQYATDDAVLIAKALDLYANTTRLQRDHIELLLQCKEALEFANSTFTDVDMTHCYSFRLTRAALNALKVIK